MLTSFRYLGQVISEADKNWPAVISKFSRARAVWKWMTQILIREGAALWVSGLFFKAVVQAVIFFGLDTWVVIPLMGKSLEGGFGIRYENG